MLAATITLPVMPVKRFRLRREVFLQSKLIPPCDADATAQQFCLERSFGSLDLVSYRAQFISENHRKEKSALVVISYVGVGSLPLPGFILDLSGFLFLLGTSSTIPQRLSASPQCCVTGGAPCSRPAYRVLSLPPCTEDCVG